MEIIKFFVKIYSIIFVLFLIIIYPILKIKIGTIRTKSMGNGSISHEIFYHEYKNNIHKKSINLWFHQKKVANKFLLSKFKEIFIILPGYILYGPYELIYKLQISFLKVPIREWVPLEKVLKIKNVNETNPCKDIHNFLNNKNKLIKFSKKETEFAEETLNKLNIGQDDRIVCVSSRTSSWKNEIFKCVRNSNINNMAKSIKYLGDKNYKVVLIGDSYEPSEELKNLKNVIFYSNSKQKTGLLDFYLISKSKFLISNASGIGQIAIMMRKPRLITNYLSLEQAYTEEEKFNVLIIPKKVKVVKDGKYLNYIDIIKKGLTIISYEEKMLSLGYKIYENSQEEILDAVIEMEKNFDNSEKFKNNDDQKFWLDYKELSNGFAPKKLRFGEKFYKDNINLF